MSDVIVFDTETTGLTLPGVASLDQQPRIIELGAARFKRDGSRVAELSQLLMPGIELEDECANHKASAGGDCVKRGALCYKKIASINDITKDALTGKPTFKEFLPQLKDFFSGAQTLIAHNAPFDTALLNYDLARAACGDFPMPTEIVCTVSAFAHMQGPWKKRNAGKPRLIELYEVVMGRPLAQTHRALGDVNALVEVLNKTEFWKAL
jgi:DNA polymerase III epsilon subunit-like protein